MSDLIGKTLGKYHIIALLGRGGMADVYKAYQPSLKRYVAIKTLHSHLADEQDFIGRFEREATAVARLRHPNIVQVYDFDADGDVYYMVMELVEGPTLKAKIEEYSVKGQTFSLIEIARIFSVLGDATDYAHAQGIVHRDLKPANIMFTAERQVVLTDFGIARIVDATRYTLTGAVSGTPAYMSPEQGRGERGDARSDIYSLGVILYEMVTGRIPFEANSSLGIIIKHITEPAPLPRVINSDVPEAVEQVILKVISKNPDDRYQTAGELAQALREAVGLPPNPTPAIISTPVLTGIGVTTTPLGYPTPLATPYQELSAFVAGPPITRPHRFFGRERELKRLFNLWRRPPLQNAAVIGPRRSGKTSLLLYLKSITTAPPEQLRPGQRADWLSQPGHYRWIFVDFQYPRLGSREELLRYLLDSLELPAPIPCDLERFLEVVSRRLRTPTVILLDEISVALQRYPELDVTFWEGLRSLAANYVEGNLAFVLAASEPPGQLAPDSHISSPFLNIFGYTATLGPLTEPEARELVASSPIPFPSDDVDWILTQSGRWPLLLNILCRERLITLEEGQTNEVWREEGIRQLASFRHLLQVSSLEPSA